MSREETRERILEAARRLLEREGVAVPMSRIAEEAEITRRGLYFHFPSRTELLLAVVDHVDAKGPLGTLTARVWDADSASEGLDEFVALNARYNPQIREIALALADAAARDEAAAAAWNDRMKGRRKACRRIVGWLASDGRLDPSLSERDATDLLWALTGMRLWRELVVDRGWSHDRYEEHIRRLLRRALLGGQAMPAPARR